MATEIGSMSALIDKLAKTDNPKMIAELSREIREGVRQVRVKLDDPDAAHYPFTFKKGESVIRETDSGLDPTSLGFIVDGVYEGTVKPGGWYSLNYTVQRFKDGVVYEARDLHLQRFAGPLPNKREIIQGITDSIELGWSIKKPSPLDPTDIEHEVILQNVQTHAEIRLSLANALFRFTEQRPTLERLLREAIESSQKS